MTLRQIKGKRRWQPISPEQNFEQCVAGKHDIPTGGRIIAYKDRPTGSVSIQVSLQPQR